MQLVSFFKRYTAEKLTGNHLFCAQGIISAGGAMVMLIAIATIIVVLLFGSAFGIFFSNEADDR